MKSEDVYLVERDRIREHLNKYTRRAYQLLPSIDKPNILDIGCGSGVPTLELARLSNGSILAIDIDGELIEILRKRIDAAGLAHRVRAECLSLFDLDYPDERFDIVWAEGSISVIGFRKGLTEWRRLIRAGGFLVVHDELTDMNSRLSAAEECGYDLLDHFILSADIWQQEYYGPLEEHIRALRKKYGSDPEMQKLVEKEQQEIEWSKRNPERCASIFYIMQKKKI
jgi:ubiquinone/menaquinone biosynthesis C-methylase UbiE